MITQVTRLAVVAILVVATTSSAGRAVTVITGATIINGTGQFPIRKGVVVMEGDKIKAVGRQGDVRVPQGARVIDASGKYLAPGLIDMHVHYREWQGELFLTSGVTSVKDLGNPVEWISELGRRQAEGRWRGPRIFFVGNNLDAPPPEGEHHVGVASRRDYEKVMEALHGFGVSAIKVRHKVAPEQLQEITKAAHARGLPVTGHLARTNAMQAAMAGIDGLEHASGVALAAAEAPDRIKTDAKGLRAFLEDLRGFALMNEAKEKALIQLLVEKRVKLIPTLSIRRRAVIEDQGRAALEDAGLARHPALAYVPEPVRQEWSEASLDKKLRETFSVEEKHVMQAGYRRLERFVRTFHRAGGVVLAGSDNLNGAAGLTLHRELESLVAAGLTPMAALLAATRDAAQFLRRADLGTIEPGQTADLILVGADPLDDIRDLSKIEKVFQNGQELDVGFHRDYALPPARPQLVRPLLLERLLATEK
jgi:imidazolonepropionase-like amidohydrolase